MRGTRWQQAGGMIAKLWPIFAEVQQKIWKRNENQRFKPSRRRQISLQASMIRTIVMRI